MARRRQHQRCVCGACEARKRGISYEEWIDGHLLRMHDRIRTIGYTCTGVFGGGGEPPRVYTTGLLDTFGHPELIVVGLQVEEGYELLVAWAALIKSYLHPKVGVVDDAAGFRAKFIEVHPRYCEDDSNQFADWHRYHWFLGCSLFPLRVLQLLYADGAGRFPGDDGYDPGVQQRLLDQ